MVNKNRRFIFYHFKSFLKNLLWLISILGIQIIKMNTFIYGGIQNILMYTKTGIVCQNLEGDTMKEKSFEDGWNDPRSFVFGNGTFGGYYRPGEFEFKGPGELSPEEFEEYITKKVRAFHNMGKEFGQRHFDHHFDEKSKSKKERLQPLSIRVKPHTKEFLKNDSVLSAREILELYEDFNNNSEAFINSLLEDEKNLQDELEQIQAKLENAKLFREKLEEIQKEDDGE